MRRPATSAYRALLVAFPRTFRVAHGEAMTAEFARQYDALAGRPLKRLRLWGRAALDAVQHGAGVRRDSARRGRSSTHLSRFAGAGSWGIDLRDALRGLRRTPGVTCAVLAILALGVAANSVMVGTIDQLLLRAPAGIGEADSIRRVYFGNEKPSPNSVRGATVTSYPYADAIRSQVPAFERATVTHRVTTTLGAGAGARSVAIDLVEAAYFPLLHLQPSLGRFFSEEESTVAGAAPVVVVSDRLWRGYLGGDPSVIGRALSVEGMTLTVVGVGPRGFVGLEDEAADLWTPLPTLAPTLIGSRWATSPGRWAYGIVAALRPGTADTVADTQATSVVRQVSAGLDMPGGDDATAFMAPLTRLASPNGILPQGQVSLWLLGVSAIVLLVSVANVAGLLLTRAVSRRRETAVRLALGVSRGRLVRQFLTESTILAGGAVVLALGITAAAGQLVQTTLLPGFAWRETVVDAQVFTLSMAIGLVIAFATALLPALQGLSTEPVAALRGGTRGDTARPGVARTALLMVQIALCTVLLVGAGLFTQSLRAALSKDVGLDFDRLIQVRLPQRPGHALDAVDAAHARVVEALTRLPQVEAVAVPRGSAPKSSSRGVSTRPEGWDLTALNGRAMPAVFGVDERYFSTLGMRVVAGRGFTSADLQSAAPVLVVNRAFADDFYPGVDALGQCVLVGSSRPCVTIIGLVDNSLMYQRTRVNSPQVFLPASHPQVAAYAPSAILVRTSVPATDAVPAIRATVQGLTPDMPFVPIDALAGLTASELQPWRLGMTMFVLFGGVAFVIALVGVYSVMAHAVAQRTHEIGVRMALGASRAHVIYRVGRSAAAIIVAGVVAGLLVSLGIAPRLTDLLFETPARDPVVYGAAALLLCLAGAFAALVPVRRSAVVDPIVALRSE
ncbi:MAG: hypothetical protein AMXMBFR57_18400 [Acidimicrobiia bacterium]